MSSYRQRALVATAESLLSRKSQGNPVQSLTYHIRYPEYLPG